MWQTWARDHDDVSTRLQLTTKHKGAIGLFVGAASGIMRNTVPVLFSLVTGAQWFALGSSFYGKTWPFLFN